MAIYTDGEGPDDKFRTTAFQTADLSEELYLDLERHEGFRWGYTYSIEVIDTIYKNTNGKQSLIDHSPDFDRQTRVTKVIGKKAVSKETCFDLNIDPIASSNPRGLTENTNVKGFLSLFEPNEIGFASPDVRKKIYNLIETDKSAFLLKGCFLDMPNTKITFTKVVPR